MQAFVMSTSTGMVLLIEMCVVVSADAAPTNQVLIHGPCPTDTYSATNCYCQLQLLLLLLLLLFLLLHIIPRVVTKHWLPAAFAG